MEKTKEIAIGFTKWMDHYGWVDMYQDIDNDGKTWSSIDHCLPISEAARFKIDDLFNDYLIEIDEI